MIAWGVLTSVHIYHSMWPLMGAHAIRQPILPALPGIRLPGVVERYHQMLAAGDALGMLEQFDGGGIIRAPDGEDDVYRGRSELLRFFGRLFSTGGVSLECCSLTDDGTSCAVEYNLTACGSAPRPHQAGIAVYQRTGAGALAAVRLYDDIARPASAERVLPGDSGGLGLGT